MDIDVEGVLAAIGPRLRALRRERGLTLEALAAVTGLSVSALSRLESGKRRPTLDLLLPLAHVHGIALDRLIAAPATGDPRVHLTPRRSPNGSVVVPLTQYPGRHRVFKQVLAPTPRRLVTHPGREWLHVLAGDVLLVLDTHETVLHPGTTAEFDTTRPHWFGPTTHHPAEILHIFTPEAL